MNRPKPLLLTIVLSLATVVAYGAYRLWSAGGSDNSAPAADLAESLPDFVLADLDGKPVAIDSFAGRPLVVNFWATWCAPCLREIPLLKTLQAEHPEIQVIGIAVDRPEPVRAFAAELEFNYPVLVGMSDAMDAATAFGIDVFVLPSTVFTAATGASLGIHVGEIHDAQLENLTATLAALGSGELDFAGARQQLAGQR